jgi:hypothetical protein
LETVCKCRGILLTDERKKRMMIKTLNAAWVTNPLCWTYLEIRIRPVCLRLLARSDIWNLSALIWESMFLPRQYPYLVGWSSFVFVIVASRVLYSVCAWKDSPAGFEWAFLK